MFEQPKKPAKPTAKSIANFSRNMKPKKPAKPTAKSIANYKRSLRPQKPSKPTAKSIANYNRSMRTQTYKRIPNSVRYQGKIINRQNDEDRYSRHRKPESKYNLRGRTMKEKQKILNSIKYHHQLELNNMEKARQKELENKEYRTGIRKEIGDNLQRRFKLREDMPGFNTVNNIVFKPLESSDFNKIDNIDFTPENKSSNSFVMIGNVPKVSPKKISPKRGLLSRMRNKTKVRRIRLPPRKRSSVGGGNKINLLEKKSIHKRRNSPIYKGLGSDLIMSYIYLMIKHKSLLSIAIGNKNTLKANPNPTYIGLVYLNEGGKNKLDYDKNIKSLASFISNCKTRFFMIPVSMEYPDSGAHYNLLLGDKNTGIIERFEPYGSVVKEKVHDNFDKDLKNFLKSNDLDYEYKIPKDFIQQKGFQELEELQINNKVGSVRSNDYRGYCGMWSIWFVDLKMRNKDMSSKELLSLALKKMKGKNFRKFIRNYTNFLVEMRKVILEKTDKKCKKDDDGKSPGYNLYKDCVARFLREHLDEYF